MLFEMEMTETLSITSESCNCNPWNIILDFFEEQVQAIEVTVLWPS